MAYKAMYAHVHVPSTTPQRETSTHKDGASCLKSELGQQQALDQSVGENGHWRHLGDGSYGDTGLEGPGQYVT